jgi:hypothetical protein
MIRKYKNKISQENWVLFLVYHGDEKCERCGYSGPALDLHHLDRTQKKGSTDNLSAIISKHGFSEWMKDLKYALLCRNCHFELHAAIWKIEDISSVISAREERQKKLKIPDISNIPAKYRRSKKWNPYL